MLIPLETLAQHFKLHLRGVLHIGAHECEEQEVYLRHNVDNSNIYWIEAKMEDKVKLMKEKNKNLNIYQAVIDVEDDKEISFNVADNGRFFYIRIWNRINIFIIRM